MCCEHLVCAACAGPVVEARCPACRVTRARAHDGTAPRVPEWLAVLAVLLVAVTVLLAQYT